MAKPVINSVLVLTGTKSSPIGNYTITATNVPTSYSATGLPTGLAVNAWTGVISGTPTVSGSFHVTIKATNADGTGTQTLVTTIAITPTELATEILKYIQDGKRLGRLQVAREYQLLQKLVYWKNQLEIIS